MFVKKTDIDFIFCSPRVEEGSSFMDGLFLEDVGWLAPNFRNAAI